MTVPESAAAVFERVLGEHAATSRSGAECACGWTGDRSSDIPYIEEFRAHVAAQLATALCDDLSRSEGKLSELSDSGTESLTAQPDTLGDGGGLRDAVGGLAEHLYQRQEGAWARFLNAGSAGAEALWQGRFDAYADATKKTRALLTQPSATSEKGGQDE